MKIIHDPSAKLRRLNPRDDAFLYSCRHNIYINSGVLSGSDRKSNENIKRKRYTNGYKKKKPGKYLIEIQKLN